jgi:hypothetical protein
MPFREERLSQTKMAIGSFKELFNYLRASPIPCGVKPRLEFRERAFRLRRASHLDLICRTAGDVIRMPGGKKGGSREASPYPY